MALELDQSAPEDIHDVLEDFIPDLTALCQHAWVMEIVLDYCKLRGRLHART